MTLIQADRRKIEAEADPEGERIARDLAGRYLDTRLQLARVLVRLHRRGTYHLTAASSIVHYAVGLGIPAGEARMLVDLGRTLDTEVEVPGAPGDESRTARVEDLVRTGRISAENAAVVGKLMEKPGLIRPGDDWFRRAATQSPHELRKAVSARIEQVAQGSSDLIPVTVHIPQATREEFRRAQVIASREARLALTEGQVFGVVVRHYLNAKDPCRRGEGSRRVGATSERPDDRYVPAAVRQDVLARSGDRCEVPGCTFDTFLEYAHLAAHAAGGDREPENLVRLCHVHHVQFDADCLRFGGWRHGHPIFRDLRGRELGHRPVVGAAGRAAGAYGAEADDDAGGASGNERAPHVAERPPPMYAAG